MSELTHNVLYVVIRTPDSLMLRYNCHGKVPCECLYIESAMPAGFGLSVATILKDSQQNMKQLMIARKAGLVYLETTDQKKAEEFAMNYIESGQYKDALN